MSLFNHCLEFGVLHFQREQGQAPVPQSDLRWLDTGTSVKIQATKALPLLAALGSIVFQRNKTKQKANHSVSRRKENLAHMSLKVSPEPLITALPQLSTTFWITPKETTGHISYGPFPHHQKHLDSPQPVTG